MHYLYKLTFPNEKVYIGQTTNFAMRMRGHKNDSFNPNRISRNCQVNNAIRKYGWNNVKKEVILSCEEKDIDNLEKKYIALLCSSNRNFGYNREGGGNAKKTVSEESRKLIAEARKGKRQWGKPVLQIDAVTGKVIKEWSCISEAARELKASEGNISAMCNGREKTCCINGKKYFSTPRTVMGFKWSFIR